MRTMRRTPSKQLLNACGCDETGSQGTVTAPEEKSREPWTFANLLSRLFCFTVPGLLRETTAASSPS